MQAAFEKIIEKLEEEKMSYFLTIANTGDEKLDCAYEHTGDALDKAIEIVKQEAEKYEECYKDCGDCEAYNKEKHNCPKFCKVIKESVKEIEENHNGWIPCSSGVMPRANGWYLVTNHLGVVQEQRWSANYWEKLRDDAVLAWRELPLPYQPKGEHDENTK